MKIHFNLERFGINVSQKKVYHKDNTLSLSVIESILSVIVKKYLHNDKAIRDNDGKVIYPPQISEGVDIAAENFKKISTTHYPLYIEFLIDKNIIIKNDGYTVGVKSRTYYLTDLFKSQAKVIDIDFGMDKFERTVTTKSVIEPSILRKIERDYMAIKVLSLDVIKERKENGYPDFKNYLSNSINLRHIYQKNGYYKIEYPNNRIVTNFVNLSGPVRLNNISWGGHNLCTKDIPSSFPLMLSLWLIKNGMKPDDYEMMEFVRGLNCGEFYNHLCTKLNNNKDNNRDQVYAKANYTRDTAKKTFQLWLNGKNINKDGKVTNTDINYIMDHYYPTIQSIFFLAKVKNNSVYYILEAMESNFIFNTICKRLYDEVQGIKILTCHDAIYYESCYETTVNEIWTEEIGKLWSQLIFDPDDMNYFKRNKKRTKEANTLVNFDEEYGIPEDTVEEPRKELEWKGPITDEFWDNIHLYQLPKGFIGEPSRKPIFDHEEDLEDEIDFGENIYDDDDDLYEL